MELILLYIALGILVVRLIYVEIRQSALGKTVYFKRLKVKNISFDHRVAVEEVTYGKVVGHLGMMTYVCLGNEGCAVEVHPGAMVSREDYEVASVKATGQRT